MTEHGHDQKEPWVAVFWGKGETVFEKPGLREQSTDERGRGDLEEDREVRLGYRCGPFRRMRTQSCSETSLLQRTPHVSGLAPGF